MNHTVIACRTIEAELLAAMDRVNAVRPVLWVEQGLHNTPLKLRVRLDELIHTITDGRILMAMGACGNALAGLRADHAELVIPRVDDCITLLLGSSDRRREIGEELAAYFLTDGWMKGERNLWAEHQRTVKKYGQKRAMKIAKVLYGHYRSLALLDSEAVPAAPLIKSTKVIADTFSMEQKVIPATLTYLEDLLTGPWDPDRFIVKPPGSVVLERDFFISGD